MLTLALKAQIPIIAARTSDTLNFPEVLTSLTGLKAVTLPVTFELVPKTVYLHHGSLKDPKSGAKLYEKLVKAECSLILLNPKEIAEPMFDAGEVPVPKDMIVSMLRELCDDDTRAQQLARALGGCTIKEAVELARLTMARDHSLTSDGLVESRKQAFRGQKGLQQVDTRQALYVPPAGLLHWVAKERAFFLSDQIDQRLVPRGLLFDGPPGTGKSAGSKWLATQLGVPLYRLDMGTTKGKYVGDSEGALASNLAKLDREEPCVVLIDEVEKVLNRSEANDGGTTSSMLGQILWWLAEHRSRVLTVMTTNDRSKLPAELYREGRIDQVLWFDGLELDDAILFMRQVVSTFGGVEVDIDALRLIVLQLLTEHDKEKGTHGRVSQALLTKASYDLLKKSSI